MEMLSTQQRLAQLCALHRVLEPALMQKFEWHLSQSISVGRNLFPFVRWTCFHCTHLAFIHTPTFPPQAWKKLLGYFKISPNSLICGTKTFFEQIDERKKKQVDGKTPSVSRCLATERSMDFLGAVDFFSRWRAFKEATSPCRCHGELNPNLQWNRAWPFVVLFLCSLCWPKGALGPPYKGSIS